jgi:hypothetical protein
MIVSMGMGAMMSCMPAVVMTTWVVVPVTIIFMARTVTIRSLVVLETTI